MTEMAALALREAIIKGNLTPGTALIPAKLEGQLSLGRVAIREAIRELAGSGLVESIPNKGTFVAAPLTLEEIKEIYTIRYQIEAKAAALGAGRITEEDLKRMEALHAMMCDESLPILDYFLPNREFHFILYQASGWSYLYKLISQIGDRVLAFRSFRHYTIGDPSIFNQQHQMILDALKAGQFKKVGQLVKENLRSGLDHILNLASKRPT
jgi:DNA-binding GntR family transcriptional regulator